MAVEAYIKSCKNVDSNKKHAGLEVYKKSLNKAKLGFSED